MSALAELPELVGFFSYSREDDEAFKGTLSALRDAISRELSAQLGRSKTNFRLWQDQTAISPGKEWESEIKTAIEQSVFMLPIVTPRTINSKYCKFEFESFLAREKAIGRNDLIFPILYISVAALEDEAKWHNDPVLSIIGRRQYVDWRPLRYLDVDSPRVREQVGVLCRKIVEALNEPWVSPEERRRVEEDKARQLAKVQRLEAEAKRRADEEEHLRQAEAEAQQRAEHQRAEAKRRADEEEGRRRVDAETRQRTEKERARQEEETKRRAEQEHEQAFAAAKRADTVDAVDAFLANYAENRHTVEARTLRTALAAREEACKAATASDDPAVLKAFLKTYPNGSSAKQVRGRLRGLEPWARGLLLFGCLLGVGLVGSIAVLVINNYGPAPQTPAVQAAPQSAPVGAEASLSLQGWLGVRIQQVTDDIADSLNIKPAKGALVEGVEDKGPAKPAGIEPGDVIVKFDGKDVNEMKDLPGMVATTPVGKYVEVVIIRKGQEAKKTVKLGRLVDAPSNQDGRPAK